MKRHWMLAFLIAGALVISTVAQDVNEQSPNTVVTQQQGSSDSGEHTIVVNVWSKSGPEEPKPVTMSSAFASAGLNGAFKMELTERKIENSIRRGFPLGEFWIQNDLAEVDDTLIAGRSLRRERRRSTSVAGTRKAKRSAADLERLAD